MSLFAEAEQLRDVSQRPVKNLRAAVRRPSSVKEKTTVTVETAGITGVSVLLISSNSLLGSVCRSAPAIKMATVASSNEVKKENTAAEATPGIMLGKTTSKKAKATRLPTLAH